MTNTTGHHPLTTTWHDATDGPARPGEVNAARWEHTIASTHTNRRGWIVWFAKNIKCCPTQQGWHAESVPRVWDTSGVGNIECASYVQCGGCGTLLCPEHEIVDTATEIEAAAARLLACHEEETAEAVQEVQEQVQAELREALELVAAGEDVGDVTTGSEYHPGLYLDGSELICWDYHPAIDGDIIEATATLEED